MLSIAPVPSFPYVKADLNKTGNEELHLGKRLEELEFSKQNRGHKDTQCYQ